MTVSQGSALLWKVTTPGLACVSQTIASPDEHYILALADGCGYIQLWDVEQKRRLTTYKSPEYRLNSAAFTPDSRRVLLSFGGNDDSATGFDASAESVYALPESSLWDVKSGKRIGPVKNAKRDSYYDKYVVFSSDGKRMMFTNGYGPASIFDAFTGKWIQTFSRYEGRAAQSATFSPNGKRATVTYVSGAVVTYDIQSGQRLKVLKPSQPGN